MEIENDGMLPFLGIQLLNKSTQIQTKTYIKPTNTGLLLHYKSHVDDRYKRGLLKTMLDRAFRLSSNWSYFSEECDRLKIVFSRLDYPGKLVNSTISLASLPIKHLINQLLDYQLLPTCKILSALSCRLKTRPLLILYEHNSMI